MILPYEAVEMSYEEPGAPVFLLGNTNDRKFPPLIDVLLQHRKITLLLLSFSPAEGS